MAVPPILDNKHPSAPSVFVPAALMREARRQKNIKETEVPAVCLLDPDGDVVRHLRRTGRAKPFAGWPCYHTELDVFTLAGRDVGIVGRAVGASFAVLVAEELFTSGCRLLISLTSSGRRNHEPEKRGTLDRTMRMPQRSLRPPWPRSSSAL